MRGDGLIFAEDAGRLFYESPVMRHFAGVDLGVAAAPDETMVLRFRHLLKQHDLGGEMLDTVNHPGKQRHPHDHRHHRGRDDYLRAQFDEEYERGARP